MGVDCYLAFLALLKWNNLDGRMVKREKSDFLSGSDILQTLKSFCPPEVE